MYRLALVALLGSLAFGQEVIREFHLKNVTSPADLQELATTIRTVAQIKQLSVDLATATMTVKGTADQIALVAWMVSGLDVTAQTNPEPQEFHVAGSSDDMVVLFALAHATSTISLQEIVTTLRTVGDIQVIYMSTPARMVAFRGNASRIALGKILLSELDQAAQTRQVATIHDFHVEVANTHGRPPLDTLLVYGLAHTGNGISMQEIITTLRTLLDVQNVYQVFEPKLLAVRGTTTSVQMAKWLITELDRLTPDTTGNEAHVPGGNDDVVHVFYLTHVTTGPAIRDLVIAVRTMANISRAYSQTRLPALVLRGTADQIAMAGRMIAASDTLAH